MITFFTNDSSIKAEMQGIPRAYIILIGYAVMRNLLEGKSEVFDYVRYAACALRVSRVRVMPGRFTTPFYNEGLDMNCEM